MCEIQSISFAFLGKLYVTFHNVDPALKNATNAQTVICLEKLKGFAFFSKIAIFIPILCCS